MNEIGRELEKAKVGLKVIEDYYRTLVEEMNDYVILQLDIKGNIQNWNNSAEKIKGYKAEEIIGKNFRIFYTLADQHIGLPEQLIEEAFNKGKASREAMCVIKSGETFARKVTITALYDENGKVTGFLKITRDLTAGRKAEEHFRLIVESAPNAMVLVNKEGKISFVNSQAEKLFGHRREDLIMKSVEMLIPDRFIHKHPGYRDSFFTTPEARSMGVGRDLYAMRKDRTEFPVEIGLNPIETPEGSMVLAAIIDITERKKAEERFRLIVESAPNAMVLVNKEGKISLVNSETEKLFRYRREDLINQNIEILIPERYKGKHSGFRASFFNAPEARSMGIGRDLYAMRKDRTEFPVEIGLNPIETPDGPMVLAAIIDITERKKAEERFRLVVESAPNAMVLVNQDGKITLVNSQTEKLFGYDRNDLMGKGVESLIPERFKTNHPDFRKMFFSKPQTRSMGAGRDLFAMRKDGSEFPVEIGLNPIESPEGNMVLASIIDITERKIQEANRLKSDFLANMSHELRTPLNAILGFSEMLIDKKVGPLNEKQSEYLSDIHTSGNHLLHLINDVLDIAKIESGKMELVIESFNLIEEVEGVINILKPLADKKRIQIDQVFDDIGNVKIDKNKFRQILYNLLSNALKFNQPEGQVTIKTSRQGANSFVLSVKDTGIGISDANLKKLFIPFVQLDSGTARRHEGTGLGLALTKNIIEMHHGEISVESVVGKGSIFSVTMPIQIHEGNK